ncbi:MAG: hypothetical protein IJ139_00620 [Bacteroidaceae bacterium]|nr:hypothetical protein [Bacteroidaceae bacterium]MBQ9175356.1 hypothetical protein [Bacteroidaceae bacterium]
MKRIVIIDGGPRKMFNTALTNARLYIFPIQLSRQPFVGIHSIQHSWPLCRLGSVTFTLTTDDSPLRLGIRKQNTIDADWVAYDHFQLHYLGDATAIRPIDNGQMTIENSPIYNVQGMRLNSLQKGLNIVGNKLIFIK